MLSWIWVFLGIKGGKLNRHYLDVDILSNPVAVEKSVSRIFLESESQPVVTV